MVAHTGFLLFARRVDLSEDPRLADLLAEQHLAGEPATNVIVEEMPENSDIE
jgi:hypothetical protein